MKPSRKWILPAVSVAAIAIAALGYWLWPSTADTSAASPAAKGAPPGGSGKGGPGRGGGRFGADPNRVQPVAAVAARKGDMRIIQTSLGTVSASRTVTVKPRVDGQLVKVNFREGQTVRFNDVIAEIDPATFLVNLAQAEGQLARDQALLANSRVDLERYRALLAQDSIAKQQVDAQAALVLQHEAAVKINRAAVDNAKLQLSYTKVKAPLTGLTGLRQVDPGNMVRASDTNGLVVITAVEPIAATFTIPQDALPRVLAEIKQGDKLPVEAWDRDQKNRLAVGTLITTDNQVDVATGTVKLKAEFPNTDGKLFPNQFVNVRMVVDTRKDATLIPASAIQRGPQGTVVYVVKEDNTVGLRPVVVGPQEGPMVAIEGGVQPGERVVTDGIDRLREGAKVEVVQPQSRSGPGERGRGPATPSSTPPAATAPPAKLSPAPAKPAAPPAATESREEFRKRVEGMSPEERREALRKRMESMSPQERDKMREEFRKRREASGG